MATAKAIEDVNEKEVKDDSNLVKLRRQLLKTIRKGGLEVFKQVVEELKRDVEPNAIKTLLETKDNRGWTLLHESCRSKISTFSAILIDLGADVNSLTLELSTPLVVAAYNGRPQVAQDLMRAGALLDLKDHENKTALDIARERGNAQIVDLILSHNAKEEGPANASGEESKRIKLQ